MSTRIFRTILIIALLFISLSSATLQFVQAERNSQASENKDAMLEILAAATVYDADQLELVDIMPIKLINGVELTRIKAINPISGETVGATFLGEQMVDEQALQARASAEWRAKYGALTPDLVDKLSRMGPEDRLDVAVWLAAEVQPLPKPDRSPSASEESKWGTAVDEIAVEAELEPASNAESKPGTQPLPLDQVPESVRAQAGYLNQPERSPVPQEASKTEAELDSIFSPPDDQVKKQNNARLEEIESFKRQNEAALRAQLTPLRERFSAYLESRELTVHYFSEIAPYVYLDDVPLHQLKDLAFHPDVDAVYDATLPGGPSQANARNTQNMDLVETWGGYTGDGINVAVVEGERVTEANPNLTVVGVRDNTRTPQWHPTLVGGIIASTNATVRGLAPDADVYSANGDDYQTIAAVEAAMDWGATQADILNNSFWAANCGDSSSLFAIDRHMDYIVRYFYDLAAHASGNHRSLSNSCNGSIADFVDSPGKGYNVLTVGNYNDGGTLGWGDDVMNSSSQYNISGRHKPEVAASGTNITGLSLSDPWTGTTGSGTSFSSPMVAALAADMIEADPDISNYPEAITAVIMATSLHNIEGDQRLSRVDGVGSIDGSAALVSMERGHWASQSISSSTTFPLNFYQYAYKGERVRYVIRWLSNPTSDYTSDPAPPDLDLRVYRADGTFVQSSSWASNSFEIVDFIAPGSETYRFEVSLFGSWTGSQTWLGRGWWRGTYRISPDSGYSDPKASPMGTHLSVFPTDWSPTNYWRAIGIRPSNSDHDLRLYSRSFFDDPNERNYLEGSAYSSDLVDFITVDGNHWSSANPEHYLIYNFSGDGGYTVSWSNQGVLLNATGFYGPYSMGSNEVVKVFDARFDPYEFKRIMIIPENNNTDLAGELFLSNSGSSSSWSQSRGDAVEKADGSTSPGDAETLIYYNNSSTFDYLGLVVYSKLPQTGNFYIYYAPNAIYLPLVIR